VPEVVEADRPDSGTVEESAEAAGETESGHRGSAPYRRSLCAWEANLPQGHRGTGTGTD
jgi:hypothetical protein